MGVVDSSDEYTDMNVEHVEGRNKEDGGRFDLESSELQNTNKRLEKPWDLGSEDLGSDSSNTDTEEETIEKIKLENNYIQFEKKIERPWDLGSVKLEEKNCMLSYYKPEKESMWEGSGDISTENALSIDQGPLL